APARGHDDPRRPRVLHRAPAVPHGRPEGMAELRRADRCARPHARQAPGAQVRRRPFRLARVGRGSHRRLPAALPECERRPCRPHAAPPAAGEPRSREGAALLRRVPGPDPLRIRSRPRPRPVRRGVRGRGACGLARGLAVPRGQRRAALDRVRGAIPRPRAAARGAREGLCRECRPVVPDGLDRACGNAMIGAAVLMLAAAASVQGEGIRLEFDGQMQTRVVATSNVDEALGPFTESESLLTAKGPFGGFALQRQATEAVADALGEGRRAVLTGRAGALTKEVEVTAYAGRPRWLFLRVRYRNEGKEPIQVAGYSSHRYEFGPGPFRGEPAFWSYQSASYESRPDWVLPLGPGYERANYLGMNDSDYGGGTPVLDVWRHAVGLAIGHVELVPKLVSLPVERLASGRAGLALTASRHV